MACGGARSICSPGPRSTWRRSRRIWPQLGSLDRFVSEQIEIDAKYAVYLERQTADIEDFRRSEAVVLPEDLDFAALDGLSHELSERLARVRPGTLGQAARIEGMTPAALALLLAGSKRLSERNRPAA